MDGEVTARDLELLQGKNFGHFVTLQPDGSAHSSVVWIDWDGEHVLVNTTEGRVKLENVRRDPRVTLSVHDQDNPYRALTLLGRVTQTTDDGAEQHIDALSRKYIGRDYPQEWRNPGDHRVIIKFKPQKVIRYN